MRIVNAIVYAIVAGLGVIVASGKVPEDIVAWCGLALTVITAGWGKYMNNDSLIEANRKVWTEEERRAAAGLPPKKPGV